MPTARVFKSGNSQAVRLPKAFRFRSNQVEIFRRGNEIVMREKNEGMARVFDILTGLPEDALLDRPADPQPQRRKGL